MRVYTQLTQVQRYQLEALYKSGHNQTMIANILTVHKSTISRELRRNRGLRGYRPKQAHAKAMQRRHEKLKTHIPLTTWVVVNTLIEQDWSPEQISGRLKESRSATNGFTFTFMEVLYTSTCVARKNVVSVMGNRITGAAFPTSVALMTVQLSLTVNPGSVTGKAIR